jgi:hypothetical protein
MGEARAHYTDMVLEDRKAAFLQVQGDQRYNLILLGEHQRVEVQLAGSGIVANIDVDE